MIVCLDLEGVLVPEIWIGVAEHTRVPELRLTTRDEPDYDALMRRRLRILKEKNLRLRDLRRVIGRISPLPGARAFLDRLRQKRQVVILSDTYYEFAWPLLEKLGRPVLFCNELKIDPRGFIADYCLRQKEGKKNAVEGLKRMGFKVAAAGDSYNDIGMLKAADKGFLFNPPSKIAREYPRFPVIRGYERLLKVL